jgi:hypothetical protein
MNLARHAQSFAWWAPATRVSTPAGRCATLRDELKRPPQRLVTRRTLDALHHSGALRASALPKEPATT